MLSMSIILSIILGGCMLILLMIVKSLLEKRRIFEFARKFPGYRFYPVIGNGYHVIGKNIFHATQKIIKKFGLPCNMWLGHTYHYMTADPKEIKIILNHPNTFEKATIYGNMDLGFKESLLLATPIDVWKKNRKHHARSFSQPVLNSFVQFFYKKSQILVDTVLKDAHKRDTFEIFEAFAIESFFAGMLGFDYDFQVNPKFNWVECMGQIQAVGGKRLITYFYYPEIVFIMTREGRKAMRYLKQAMNFVLDVIKEKRELFVDNPVSCDSSSTALALLDSLLLDKKAKFTDSLIWDEMFLFTTAATDTSGYTLAYFFTLLGMHPHIQEKVYEEVKSVVGNDRPIYFEDLPNLKYLERAFLETIRILPVVPFLGRRATADVNLGNNKVLPKGSNVMISIFDLHRNEHFWPEPLKYDPDRFLPEKVAERDPYTYLAFAAGPRNCIGKTYTMMLMKTCAANVVRHYQICSPYKSVRELKLKSCITMKTTHPLKCEFRSRKCD